MKLLVALFLLIITTSVAWAQNVSNTLPSEPTAATRGLDLAFQILIVILPIVAVWLTHRAIALFEKKFGMDIPSKQEETIDSWVLQGIALATEKAHQVAKKKTDELSGPAKLEEAAKYVHDLAQTRGWVEWTVSKIKSKIEAQLGQDR